MLMADRITLILKIEVLEAENASLKGERSKLKRHANRGRY
jgi:hypothetical protein